MAENIRWAAAIKDELPKLLKSMPGDMGDFFDKFLNEFDRLADHCRRLINAYQDELSANATYRELVFSLRPFKAICHEIDNMAANTRRVESYLKLLDINVKPLDSNNGIGEPRSWYLELCELDKELADTCRGACERGVMGHLLKFSNYGHRDENMEEICRIMDMLEQVHFKRTHDGLKGETFAKTIEYAKTMCARLIEGNRKFSQLSKSFQEGGARVLRLMEKMG